VLKQLLGSLRSTPVELVFCAGDMVHFRCATDLPYNQVRKVRAKLPEGHMFAAKILVQRIDDRTDLHVGQLLEPVEALPHLRQLLPLPFEDRREHPRVERKVRVLSPQLQGFSALTRDLSVDGACLYVNYLVPVGTKLQLEVDLDVALPQPLRLELETRWAAPDLFSNNHLVGGRFDGLSHSQRQNLKHYLARTQ
jgi:hypothetical protein